MTKQRFLHVPGYGQFYIQDPKVFDLLATSKFSKDDIEKNRYSVGAGIVTVFVKSEITEIPIEFEIHTKEPPSSTQNWDRVVEAKIKISSGEIALVGCPDGPEYGSFGRLPVQNGEYQLRIYYGGQSLSQADGSTNDFYLIDVWPSVTP